ncbi:MAG: twin-arginine translocase subunit TatC [Haloferacaceae archaeon]
MASSLDEDTRRAIDEGRATAGDMLRAAQSDLRRVFLVFLVGFIGSFYALRLYVWDFLKAVTEARMNEATQQSYEIIAQTPFDVILLQAKIGMVVGVLMAIPPFLYYSKDALVERGLWPSTPLPLWKALPIVGLSLALFLGGLAYGYGFFFPFMFSFLAGNALSVGFTPTYSIVLWAEFIFLLTLSFGLAAQLPLAITGLSYAEIVQYETFRDKWRYAVVGMFAFGALFTPPDPFTQVMWATPMLLLYGASLYLAKVVVTAKRGSGRIDARAVVRRHWNTVAGAGLVGFVAIYWFYTRGGVARVNDLLAWVGSQYRVLPAGTTLGVSPEVAAAVYGVGGAVVGLIAAVAYHVYAELEAAVEGAKAKAEAEAEAAGAGAPGDIDLTALDAEGVRAAPPEAFADISEDEATRIAGQALEADEEEKARAVLDRFDEVQAELEEGAGTDAGGTDVRDRTERAAGTFADELTEGEADEDEIGGYIDDVSFVVDSLTSKSFRIAAVFAVVLAGTFGWLYTGGIGAVFDHFLSRLPDVVAPDTIRVVALHPMEALIFEVKFSTLVAVAATLPLVAYYAWPALRERGLVRRHRRTVFIWTGTLLAGLVGGFAVGYLYVAPGIISFLVADAIRADMVIAYRISDFFWLIFFTTAGIGILLDIPVFMVLLNTAGIPYRAMRDRWREVTVAIMAFAAVFTPADAITMLLVTVPLMAAYGLGLGVLFLVTLGGRRDLAPPRASDPG